MISCDGWSRETYPVANAFSLSFIRVTNNDLPIIRVKESSSREYLASYDNFGGDYLRGQTIFESRDSAIPKYFNTVTFDKQYEDDFIIEVKFRAEENYGYLKVELLGDGVAFVSGNDGTDKPISQLEKNKFPSGTYMLTIQDNKYQKKLVDNVVIEKGKTAVKRYNISNGSEFGSNTEDLIYFDDGDVIISYYPPKATVELIMQDGKVELLHEWKQLLTLPKGEYLLNVYAKDYESKQVEFQVDPYEVTRAQWKEIMNRSIPLLEYETPIENVCWNRAIKFCNQLSKSEGFDPFYLTGFGNDKNNLNIEDNSRNIIRCDFDANGYRLPSEVEWEYVAKGGQLAFSNDETFIDATKDKEQVEGRCSKNKKEVTVFCGSSGPNVLGIYDLTSNVSEWCGDWYSEDYYTLHLK